MKVTAESGYLKNLMLFYFPVHFHFTSGVMHLMVDLDQCVSAVLTHRLEQSCALGEFGTLADICLGA